eukprot:CAMPEP_0116127462 /NCGR_PEP_ID=MMETSP0329-20121206/6852_1 /TAXON_ID=697910 /ORGANISM="Pseudo-nitzschia arenysensis, Strain B593" /LENGTH=420 /DNA_ID=CAMNT_0003621561 /DNA_START=149 /DNA_END=1411 /DNA_ORIENTATION=-
MARQLPAVAAFTNSQPQQHVCSGKLHSTAACETTTDETRVDSSKLQPWLEKGLILSSFTDGLKTNPPAIDWLLQALVETLWKEAQASTQRALHESNLASPCNGPDPALLEELEATDAILEGLQKEQTQQEQWKEDLRGFCKTNHHSVHLRILYIPTAMYALRPNSTSKPGKQRGRNRADGKKRRNEIVQLLTSQLQDFCSSSNSETRFTVSTVTLDFDDASVKQPESVVVGKDSEDGTNEIEEGSFPESGKEAIREWNPHLIYVQGGNTFWLHHCMEKGGWDEDLIAACCRASSTSSSNDKAKFSSIYCGVSAGSILAGESMQTACWKEWDDPSVILDKPTYQDWTKIRGLASTGGVSWFPHMTEEWYETTQEKTKILLETVDANDDDDDDKKTTSSSVRLIRDDQAYVVDGKTQSIREL